MDCLLSFIPAFATSFLAQAAATPTGDSPQTIAGISINQWAIIAVAIAVFALPVFLGGVIARALRMPDYATRIAWVLFALIASVTILSFYPLKQGVDLRGGTVLVYEIDPNIGHSTEAESSVDGAGDPKAKIGSAALITSLSKRINPAGTQEISLRPFGDNQIEIIVPAVDPREVAMIKDLISQAGILRFAIVANTRDHGRLIEQAKAQAEKSTQTKRLAKTIIDVDDKTPIGFWALVDREEPTGDKGGLPPLRVDVSRSIIRNAADGRLIELPLQVADAAGVSKWMQEQKIENIQVLMVSDDFKVTGEDLAFSSTGFDPKGAPCVRFKLNDAGSGRFYALTSNNVPDGQFFRSLGIVLDDALLSAPVIKQAIQGEGVINGNFTTAEVESLVDILQAGQLPAALTKQPIAENQIDATLGADTIRKGVIATMGSAIAVLAFMLYYYRFLGLIACLALILNLLMTMAVMILISQPLSLPGIAGLVLTIGMSVDANVLIFERIREELGKGAATRMAIRNGFSRASATILDSNLTALITAIVMYAIGTDQIRGFAITLILGIIFSMFTAIHMSRTLLDIAERHGFLSMTMSDAFMRMRDALLGKKDIDFLGLGPMAIGLSLLLLVVGAVAVAARGMTIFDIDFSGGSSVTFRLEQPSTTEQVRSVIANILTHDEGISIDYTVNNVNVGSATPGTVYKIDSSIDNVDDLKKRIADGFVADGSLKLVTYDVEIKPAGDQKTSQLGDAGNGVQLAAFYAQATATDAAPAPQVSPPEVSTPPTTESAAKTADVGAPTTPAEPADKPTAAAKPTTPEVKPVTTEVKPATPEVKPAPTEVMSRATLTLGIRGNEAGKAELNAKTLIANIIKAATAAGVSIDALGIEVLPIGPGAVDWSPESDLRFTQWEVGLPIEFGPADEVMGNLKETLGSDPIWISSSSVGSRVAGDMIGRAAAAMVASLLAIVAYIWFRFNRIHYGIAAVAALIHDVLITIGAIAVSYWLADYFGFLLVDQFKISLTVVAALLTIIGYSLNDTIVIFDRIRETKGKSVRLTREMINTSINATLSRTLLTATTTFLVVLVLYFFGGEGIHAFAFSLVIGMIAGTYSTVFIASPILLWLIEKYQPEARQA